MKITPHPEPEMRRRSADLLGEFHQNRGEIYKFITEQVCAADPRRVEEEALFAAAMRSPENARMATRYLGMRMDGFYSWDQMEKFGEPFMRFSKHVTQNGNRETLEAFAGEISNIVTHAINYRVYPYVLTAIDLLNGRPELENFELHVDKEKYEEFVRLDKRAKSGKFDPD